MTIEEILQSITRVAGVQMAAMCDYEGIVVQAEATVGSMNDEHVSAWAGEIGRAATGIADTWSGGAVRSVVFEASMGSLILADVGKGYLMVLSDPTTNAGLLRTETDQATRALRETLGAASAEQEPGDSSDRIATA